MPSLILLLILLCLGAAVAPAQVVIEEFEYGTPEELTAAWRGGANAVVSPTDSVSPRSTGFQAMQIAFTFASGQWATEVVRGPLLPEPVSIGPDQYVTLRIQGDPAFAAADFRHQYLYAYDDAGNFGRWGAPVPTSAFWEVRNFAASGIEKPWDSPALPDLGRIVRFAIVQYGSERAIPRYSATVGIDDIVVRDAPLAEEEPPVESVLEDFEYATPEALTAAWKGGSPNSVVTASSQVSPLSLGTRSMQVRFQFPSAEWTAESVQGPELATPVPIGLSQYLTFRVQGDPAFAGSDFRNLYLYVYDASGNFGRWGAPAPASSVWESRSFRARTIEKPWDSPALPDLTRIVRIGFVQYGSQAALAAYSATIRIDDIRVSDTPLTDVPPPTESVIEAFEYPTPEELTAAWTGTPRASVSPTDTVAPSSTGLTALNVRFSFASAEWTTESVRGPLLPGLLSIHPSQFLSFRVKGDPAFEIADFRTQYLYAYDDEGNFGRWGAPVPIVEDWEIRNFSVAEIEKPWDSPALPNLARIVRFSFFQYGSQTVIEPYSATVQIDDLAVRNTPLTDEPAGPRLTIVREGAQNSIQFSGLVPGVPYELQRSVDLGAWEKAADIQSDTGSTSWPVLLSEGRAFFRLSATTP